MGGNYIQGPDGKMDGSTPTNSGGGGSGSGVAKAAKASMASAFVFNVNPKTGITAEQKALAAKIMGKPAPRGGGRRR